MVYISNKLTANYIALALIFSVMNHAENIKI